MLSGSNQHTKQQVQKGLLCYVCEAAPPTLTDDVGGNVCTDCHDHMQTKLLKHVLKSGYCVIHRKAKH